MNVENMTKLRDHLQWLVNNHKEYKFNMENWLYHPSTRHKEGRISDMKRELHERSISDPVSATECGTVACLAGHAALIGGCPPDKYVDVFAEQWLRLTEDEADHLFLGEWMPRKRRSEITLQEAIDYLTCLIKRQRMDI